TRNTWRSTAESGEPHGEGNAESPRLVEALVPGRRLSTVAKSLGRGTGDPVALTFTVRRSGSAGGSRSVKRSLRTKVTVGRRAAAGSRSSDAAEWRSTQSCFSKPNGFTGSGNWVESASPEKSPSALPSVQVIAIGLA